MRYYPTTLPVPWGLTTPRLKLRMLRASDVVLDYQAVMASQAQLLLRSAGRWPRVGFTLAENLADLEMHEREHRNREAFTFTVMRPDEKMCLGCLYLKPLDVTFSLLGAASPPLQFTEPASSASFWLRPEASAVGLDRYLLDTLHSWFQDAWGFTEVLLAANDGEQRNLQLFAAAGLPHMLELAGAQGQRWSFFRA